MPEYQFAHVHIISADPVKTAEFYDQFLGAQREAVRKHPDGSTNVDLDLGGTRLQIREPRPKALLPMGFSANKGGLEHIALFTDDLDASINDLKASGVPFLQEASRNPPRSIAFFMAPENVAVELMKQRSPLAGYGDTLMKEREAMPQYTFSHVHVLNADPMKTAEFYEKFLGAQREAVRNTSEGLTNVDLDLGGTRLQIREPRPHALLPENFFPNNGGLEHIGIFTDDFDASVNALKANGVHFVQEVRQLPTHRVTFILAPENVLVQLIEKKK